LNAVNALPLGERRPCVSVKLCGNSAHVTVFDDEGEFYGDDPQKSPDYGRVIDRRNFDRLVGLLGSGRLVACGQTDFSEFYIAPTVLVDVSLNSPIMQEEVFGPILPVLEIESVEAVIAFVNP
jgi:aldehyde dehydrogenase (NAD+)